MKNLLKLSIAAVAVCGITASAGTLENVKSAGVLKCGVSTGLPGFAEVGADKQWKGLDVDVCKSVAAAVLGDASKVKIVPLTAKERFTALQSGEIDVLSRNTTWTQSRDTSLGVNFAGVNYYDGQGFLVSTKLGVNSAKQLDGASVCITAGTTTELNLADYFSANNMTYKPITYDTAAQVRKGFEAGRCDLITSDASQLYAIRTQLAAPKTYKVLPEIISKEPLGPLVRQGDDVWFNIVKWSLNALKTAEEFGITSANVDYMAANAKVPEVKRLLGTDGSLGKNLNLDAKWAYRIIKSVGNYGESFERNVGMSSPLEISRGQNALWKDGGLQYSPPFR
ncbi:MAG TPA: amino acid ABC transporter substrate-binding protein [Arcobacter sp.]|nr:amino acid ABC transporter substrate-binding protein [Arcobacter sp.]HIP55432.1 amino acid ABC transporter substrate-binding protein [Arcobacter sp.]